MYYIFPLIMFFCGLLAFSFSYNHFLITLLSLEYIVLSLFWMVFYYMILNYFDLYFLMMMLTFWVCEAVLGLSLLVSMIRGYGNDYFFSFNLVQC
uniref:NADH-ubiquinone oxidoreductase chain 4L n=2 Tax=Phraortes TaxID=590989 RepID=E2RUR4_PHRIL|nr:NADH dehydrogenase subunit 4L [Phraortes illepidus]YP_010601347.1 NADH dehydrogenase subunit 4L [Phraortes lii]WAL35426.1 NADH dehydrogenase subunit 4L [Phraortes lii]BAJ24448.1 NADH dehydrogenase subunit 4L [Phraortes illepidus]